MFRRFLFVAATCAFPLWGSLAGTIDTADGKLSGVTSGTAGVVIFRGIPFAAPPVGDLRWHAPMPNTPWQGVKKADQFSAGCVQNVAGSRDPWTAEFMTHGAVGEDCLYLNVWTAAKSFNDKRPVFVWLYGGGFNEGSGSIAAYDGEQLAKKGLVVVTINYRVGILGFFTHPELTKESGHNSSGNYGLLDQLAALEWVRKNIAGFGGDPNRVTVAGQSAGAMSVHYLTASPLAKGLFQRAIAESGSTFARSLKKLSIAEQDGLKFADAKQLHSLKELRAMTVADLSARQPVRFGPIVDGWFLPDDVDTIFALGKQNDVPALTGLVWDEGSSSPGYGKIGPADWEKQAREGFHDLADKFLKLYPVTSQTDSLRDHDMIRLNMWAMNRANTSKTNAFTYIFDHPEPGPNSDKYKVFHTSEVPYVFDSLDKCDRPWTPEDRRIAAMMSGYWTNFAKNGDPNGKGLPPWPAFAGNTPVTMELGDHTGPRPVADPAKIAFFSEYLAKQSR